MFEGFVEKNLLEAEKYLENEFNVHKKAIKVTG